MMSDSMHTAEEQLSSSSLLGVGKRGVGRNARTKLASSGCAGLSGVTACVPQNGAYADRCSAAPPR
jgi:hypothetical protein